MILEVVWVFVMLIEKLDDALLTRPHEDLVLRVSEVVRETTSKIARTKHKDFVFGGW